MAPTETITRTVERRRQPDKEGDFLFLALRGDLPRERGGRFSLRGVDSVSIGRAADLSARREGGVLSIGVPDPGMSGEHLRIERVLGEQIVCDLSSKNGTLLDGHRVDRSPLHDGAVIEAGHSFFIFRSGLPAAGHLLGPELPTDGLATLLPRLAVEMDRLRTVARSQLPVLLRGESGTGKEVTASFIHRASGRRGPFVPVNCGAIAPGLTESQLFGHRRGAFTGAVEEQAGFVRAADGGTLLLDEVGDLPLPAQAALLRVLQEGEVTPVGAVRPTRIDLRVVAATHRDLEALAAQEKFRSDLLARLSGYCCTLPPLRERREDLSLLVSALLAKAGALEACFSATAARALIRYGWPLNVRELEKCLSAAAVLARGGKIELEHFPPAVVESRAPAPPAGDDRSRELANLLREHDGNVSAVARALGKARTQVQRWLRRYRLDPGSFRR